MAKTSKRLSARATDELIGLCRGLTADDALNEKEARFLLGWLERNADISQSWIADQLLERLKDILIAQNTFAANKPELLNLIKGMVGDATLDAQVQNFAASVPFDPPFPKIKFKDQSFCFTGEFKFGTRRACERAIEDLGGTIRNAPYVTYVIVGTLANPQWKHSSYGGGLEKAISHREKMLKRCTSEADYVALVHPHLIPESHWTKELTKAQTEQSKMQDIYGGIEITP